MPPPPRLTGGALVVPINGGGGHGGCGGAGGGGPTEDFGLQDSGTFSMKSLSALEAITPFWLPSLLDPNCEGTGEWADPVMLIFSGASCWLDLGTAP